MKKLNLENASYRYLEQSFKEWLDVLGYAPTTVYNMPILLREFLKYLDTHGVTSIRNLKSDHINQYYQKLKSRSNQRRGGGLSNAHLNKHIQALRKFTDYLRKVGRLEIAAVQLSNEDAKQTITYLSEEEIQQLFNATHRPAEGRYELRTEAIQSRDRAMLAVFYGCGLRRNEGVHLDMSDINFDRSLLHVRKGKNLKERLVPISKANLKYLTGYVFDHRPTLTKGSKTDALFITYATAKRMQGQSLLIRLKKLQYLTESTELIEKEVGLHTLRHSIATHLLAAGMKFESISRFLGHSSLESTQIYTHLHPSGSSLQAHLTKKKEQPCVPDRQAFNNIPAFETGRLHEDEF